MAFQPCCEVFTDINASVLINHPAHNPPGPKSQPRSRPLPITLQQNQVNPFVKTAAPI
jgi:hypothetical protein